MCRIAGVIDFNERIEYDLENVMAGMRDSMYQGGPDDQGSYFDKQQDYVLGFGHRRLSIIDVSEAGHQPMLDKDGSVVICYNGEIYNYEEVREELKALGISFHTGSDTEVIIQAYKAWGIESIRKFIGMFAFLLYDKERGKLYVVRDRAGVKPLYYYSHNHTLLFGSELKSFHKHPAFKKEIDSAALASYLQLGYIPAPNCIFVNARKVMPGHYLEIDLHSRQLADRQYWSAIEAYQQPLIHDISHDELLKETEAKLQSACNYRMVADVPVGVFLSGGYDSSLVTALLQKDSSSKIKTFSIGFHEDAFNEAPHAKKVSEYLGTDHLEYYCSQKDALQIIPSLPEIYDEPFGDSSAIPTILVSRVARQSVKVALSADAGDEVFGGYNKYTAIMNLHRKLNFTPKLLNVALGKMIDRVNPEKFAKPRNNSLAKKASRFSRLLQSRNMGESLLWLSSLKSTTQLEHIMGKPLPSFSSNFDLSANFQSDVDDVNTMLAVDYLTYLPDDILTKVDRATMSVSLEGREPLLDHRLLEWMARIPGEKKIRNGNKKYILKEILHKYIPKELMDRPKMGFGIPIAWWFKAELKSYFEHYLSREMLKEHNLFNVDYVQEIKEAFFSGQEQYVTELWYMLMFQLWYEKWMA